MKKWRLILVVVLFGTVRVNAQQSQDAEWIANGQFDNRAGTSLYDLVRDDKPVLLAVGNIHSQSTEQLFETGALQKLTREHGVPRSMYSMGDLQVAFLNITVFPNDEVSGDFKGVHVVNMPESSDALNADSWNGLYSVRATNLFILTPDHLIFPVAAGNADELYAAAMSRTSRLHPSSSPDVRVLSVRRDIAAKSIAVSVQNFSKTPLDQVRIVMRDANGCDMFEKSFALHLAALDATTLALPLADGAPLNNVAVIARVADDANPSNNAWMGSLDAPGGAVAGR